VADEIAFVADGRVLAHGTAEELFTRCPVPRVADFLTKVLA
jgi:ABC-type polar amino acid transport system ATPase subunit